MTRCVPHPSVDPTVAALHAFTGDLCGKAATESGNLALSPHSAAVALAMVRNGAPGDTAAELDRVLHADDPDRLNCGMNTVAQRLDEYSEKCPVPTRPQHGSHCPKRLVLVNALYFAAPWEHPFHDDATRSAPFTRADGSHGTMPICPA